ncbi:nucleotidyl transferase AbiEii/AbiGii toxin family protein [Streptomyces endophyticus]|uniref:Nucleotidyl transferase AbiEii/AbiGii toxin family protein n=1 Tax=Streptomyces endophyticus TaxID=714166 RepID=A0ABU6F3F2_9ACTN|nr:nucleotidyl transferase AbiEii/AbiGii toxin family protein [Streptomyces endophyticus]MEB8338530.1 nucleotidyl transferase AbiEii/AbiGii toxin family protein [Streptomyces endophyticus]
MKLPDLHARLLADVLAIGAPYPLVLTGGYAVQAHEIVDRPSQDLDVATESSAPMQDIAATVSSGLTERGWQVQALEVAPLAARFTVTDPRGDGQVEVDVLKEVFTRPVVYLRHGPVLAEEDVIGTKVRALAERGAARDFIDVYAASSRWTHNDFEELARRHARERFGLDDLHARLEGLAWTDDVEFAAYGLRDDRIDQLRRYFQRWAADLGMRLAAPYEE